MKTLIVGAGNILRHDDGVGPYVIEQLKQHPKPDVDYLDGRTDGLALLDITKKYERVILIDAVNMGKEPGTIKAFKPEEVNIIQSDSLSTHAFGIVMLIKLMKELNIQANLTIVGIQPKDISFGEGLTETIQSKTKELIKVVKNYFRTSSHI